MNESLHVAAAIEASRVVGYSASDHPPAASENQLSALQCVAGCVVVCCSVLQCIAVYCRVLQCAAVYCNVLQKRGKLLTIHLHVTLRMHKKFSKKSIS